MSQAGFEPAKHNAADFESENRNCCEKHLNSVLPFLSGFEPDPDKAVLPSSSGFQQNTYWFINRIRTCEAVKPKDLKSYPLDHSGIIKIAVSILS